MVKVVALELAVVDLIEARVLDSADFPMSEPPHPLEKSGGLFLKSWITGSIRPTAPMMSAIQLAS
jgi:hypothetical protein